MRERQRGRVKWFDAKRGLGFIQREGLPDVFVHFSKMVSHVKTLERGAAVEFGVKPGRKAPVAVDVIRL
jgi:CspA family cold shock protein